MRYRNNVNYRCAFRCLLFSVCSFSFPLAVCRLLFNVRRSTFTVWCLRSAALNVNCAPTGRRCARRRASIAFGGMKAEGERDLRKRSKASQQCTALPDEFFFYVHNGNFSVAQLSEQLSCCVRCPVEGASAYLLLPFNTPCQHWKCFKEKLQQIDSKRAWQHFKETVRVGNVAGNLLQIVSVGGNPWSFRESTIVHCLAKFT